MVKGARVRSAKEDAATGTVRYAGQLESSPGTWIGVEWDDCGEDTESNWNRLPRHCWL